MTPESAAEHLPAHNLPSENPQFCPVYRAIGVLQEKWVLHIVRSLLSGPKGFNELSRNIGGCNSATLTQRLENLESLGIISKNTDAEAQGKLARSIYRLTPAGQELQAVIDAVGLWATEHLGAVRQEL